MFIVFSVPGLRAQTKWYDPSKAGYAVIQNQGWTNEIGKSFTRLPARAKSNVREVVWDLAQNTAGLAIHFYTNARTITVRYQIKSSAGMNHMPPTGKSGVDLYAIDDKGKWKLHTDKFLFEDTVKYIFNQVDYSPQSNGYEFRLFLPLYNDVKWMEIGVPDTAKFSFMPTLKDKPVIVYGTSIAQGGCASRPGMAWTNILSRKLKQPVINLAFSGNGPLEKEVVDYINELDATLYIFDCLPNMGGLSSDEIYKRVLYGVTALRKNHAAPILLTDHIGYRNDGLNYSTRDASARTNIAQKRAYDTLIKSGIKNLYYLTKEEINFPDDGCVDLIHPNDLGMQAYADAYFKEIQKIVSKPAKRVRAR